MPKRGSFRGNNRVWNNDRTDNFQMQDEFEVRKNISDIKRRVSFKAGAPSGRNGYNKNNRISEVSVRAHLEDDDDMGGEQNKYFNKNNRNKNGRRRGSPVPRAQMGPGGKRKLLTGPSGWYQVTIPYGHKYEKENIFKAITSAISPNTFVPHYYKVDTNNNNVSFYVDDTITAEAVLNADRRITMPGGFKLIIKVRNSIPQVQIDETLKQKMKLAMVKRFNGTTNALDLTKFHSDPDLTDVFCALFRPTVMLAAFDIIAENIPNLEALNLNDNKIQLLDHFRNLSSKLPNLKILHLGKNRIANASSLDALKGLNILDLVLEGNPIKERLKDETVYVSEIRKRFPRVVKLDGIDLPPPIGFDVSEELNMPTPKASFLCDPAGAEIVRKFLEQYFVIYDSDNRQPLLDAYHEHAMLSLTATYNQHQNNQERLTSYLQYNRNVLRVRDVEARCRHLKMGRLQVVSFLSQLPLTKHDPQSFVVDLQIFTPQLMLLTVTGVFKERKPSGKNEFLRSFQRSLIIVPSNGGFCIRNEIFHVNNATSKQERTSFKELPPQMLNNPGTSGMVPPAHQQQIQQIVQQQIQSPNTSLNDSGTSDNTKIQMVQAMSQQSNMNLEWSRKCLEETNWDFQRAGYVFTELHKQNKIPAEAFNK